MTTKTRAQLVTRALQKLMVVGSGQSPDDEDQELVDGVVESVLDDLAARSVYYVPNVGEIELAPFEWLAECLADTVAPDFGKERNPQKVLFAETRLRQIKSANPTYEILRAEYF